MQHICYSVNSCANVVDNLKHIYSLLENNFCVAILAHGFKIMLDLASNLTVSNTCIVPTKAYVNVFGLLGHLLSRNVKFNRAVV